MKKYTYLPFLIFILMFTTWACSSSNKVMKSRGADMPKKTKPKGPYKPYKEVLKDVKTDDGLFKVHKKEGKYWYEIPKDLLEKEFLWVTRIAGSVQNLSFGGAGMKARSQQVLRWQKHDNNILLRHVSFNSVANHDLPIYKSVVNNNFEPVIQTFKIATISPDSMAYVIDVTPLFNSDVRLLSGLNSSQRQRFRVTRLDGKKSYISRISSYPKNIEVRHVLTYHSNNPPDNAVTGLISLEMNQSMIMLPEVRMKPRLADERVGFFAIQQYDYGLNEQKAATRTYITKWNLVPKDIAAYKRGELVEPVKPIVYYLDPATPKKWRPYLIQGINDWQKSFEKIGFKNAIVGKEAPTPEEDPEFSPEDIRYSVMRYITTPIQNAQGPHVHDPRTGEILESDILWYHNVMNLLRNWFFVQTAAANVDARKVKFDDKIMGELIRFVSAHEVGHTLGLPHNWGSSHAYSVESLRSAEFTSKHGTAPSIMDYARFNYIAQPEDGVTNFYPAIGEYDDWSIKWGYQWFDNDTPESDKKVLDEWVKERSGDPLYFYGRQTVNKIDPRSQNEDLGDDPIKASEYGMKNLERITSNLLKWGYEADDNYDDIHEIYGQIFTQWGRYMGHVAKLIGGIEENYKLQDQAGYVYTPINAKAQKNAVQFLGKNAFETPKWLINEDILQRIDRTRGIVERIRRIQVSTLYNVLSLERLARMVETESIPNVDYYPLVSLMDDLRTSIWKEIYNNKKETLISIYRRQLQRAYLDRMDFLMKNSLPNVPARFRSFYGWTEVNASQSDIRPMIREQLVMLKEDLEKINLNSADRHAKIHVQDAIKRIENILDPKK